MTSEEKIGIDCPSCKSAIILDTTSNEVQCTVCGAGFELRGHLCPACFIYHQHDGTLCISCGTPLTRTCRNCHTANWPGIENCMVCGEPIDILAMISENGKLATARRLNRQMDRAQAIKVAEELASNRRMSEMVAIEEARQAQIRQRLVKQKDQERVLLIVVFGAVAFFFLILIAFAIFSTID